MLERHIISLRTDAAGTEDVAATRERLKGTFPPGAVRRMTQLGMLMSNILAELNPAPDDTIVYATQYAEGRTLETYLESFPTASPIGFQTSIHPGAVQQGMIRRAQPVGDFFPMAGCDYLVGQSLLSALIAPAERVVLCGGEERGTWLVPIDGAGSRAFAHAMILSRAAPPAADAAPLGRITLAPAPDAATPLAPAAWFDTLHARRDFSGIVSPGWHVTLTWQ
jgi:hypothetical protein